MSEHGEMDRLEEALELWLQFQSGHGGQSEAEFLCTNEHLRDLLEPLLAGDPADTQPGAPALPGSVVGRTIGGFRILHEIGRGGMGVVYEAWQAALDRRVAIKVLPAHLTQSPKAVARFKREAATAARLNHAGIVDIYSVFSEGDLHCFAMELIDGAPLDRVLAETARSELKTLSTASLTSAIAKLRGGDEPPAPDTQAATRRVLVAGYVHAVVDLVAQVADALQYAHDQGVIHRDVKPSNILLRTDGTPVLTDFGLAREAGLPALTATGELAGTPYYVSPEQVSSEAHDLDRRTDVFSLGVALFELLTHRRPFEADNSHAVLQQILHRDPPDPARLNPQVSPDLSAVVCKALEKDRAARYQTAAALAEDLRSCLSLRPVSARRLTLGRRLLRHARREPALAALVVLLTVVVPSLSTAFYFAESAARAEAERRATEALQISDFLVGLFEQASPYRTLGASTPVSLILDQGRQRIQSELTDQPMVRARLLSTMGKVYESLHEPATAIDLLADALKIRTTLPSRDRGEELHLRLVIAMNREILGEHGKAVAEADACLQESRGLFGEVHSTVAKALATKATIEANSGNTDEAERLMRQSVSIQRRVRPPEPESLAYRIRWLADMLNSIGLFDEAHTLLVECLELQQRAYPPAHPALIPTHLSIATNRAGVGAHDEARAAIESAIRSSERIFGVDHPRHAVVLLHEAEVHRLAGRIADAVRSLEGALAVSRKHGGALPRHTIDLLNELGTAYQTLGQFGKARTLFEQALAVAEKLLTADSVVTALLRINLADALVSLGQVAQARRTAELALATLRRVQPEGRHVAHALSAVAWTISQGDGSQRRHAKELAEEAIRISSRWRGETWNIGRCHLVLALLQNLDGAADAALAAAQKALRLFDSVRRGDAVYKALAEYHLGWAHASLKQRAAAHGHLQASIEMFRRLSQGGLNADIVWPLNHEGELLFAEGRVKEAEPLFAEAYDIRQRTLPPRNHWRLISASNLGTVYASLREYARAEPLAIAAYEGFAATLGATSPLAKGARFNLIKLYEDWGRPDEAERIRREAGR